MKGQPTKGGAMLTLSWLSFAWVFVGLWLVSPPTSAAPKTARGRLIEKAKSHFSNRKYKQALRLWERILKSNPNHFEARLRVSELRLMFGGRASARQTLEPLLSKKKQRRLSRRQKASLKNKLVQIQSVFLTDEGQTLYLKALSRARAGDYENGLKFSDQSLSVEQGNGQVLRLKALCEKRLKVYESFRQTTQQWFQGNPFNREALADWAESQVYFQEWKAVLDAFSQWVPEPKKQAKTTTNDPLAQRLELARAVALSETNQSKKARQSLTRWLAENKKAQRQNHPIAFYFLGKILSQQADQSGAATNYLKRFLSAIKQTESTLIDGWDPYRTQEHRAEAKKRLKS